MKYSKFLLATAVILIIASLYGCSLTTTSTKMVTPEIRAIGLPDLSVVDSVTLKVSGPDMEPVEVSYQVVPSVINLAIPEGNDRTFELSVELTNSPAITINSFIGTATADINTDGTVVTLNMGIGSTKIIVPDTYNNRLVQIDDMSGTGWVTAKGSDLGFSNDYDFIPNDIVLDQNGNIYIANNADNGVTDGIY
ncbi:MAG: hypothetical protein J7L71_04790, partial [Spirochaetaceae bacterium]|nr:hypothetical protein [Spirochaetaceae bacterium]